MNYRENSAINQSLLKAILSGMGSVKKAKEDELYYEEKQGLLLGSAVDVLITQGRDEFDRLYYIDTLTSKPSATIMSITKAIFDASDTNLPMSEDSVKDLILIECNKHGYQLKWKDDTRVNKVMEQGNPYYDLLCKAGEKDILSIEQYGIVNTIVNSLIESPYTGKYLTPMPGIEVRGQQAIYFKYMGEECKALLDIIYLDHHNNTIYPIDVKTMGESTKAFHRQAKRFRYDIQAAWYTLAIKSWRDEFFPSYKIAPFRFIVESTSSPGVCPLVYECTNTTINTALFGFHPIVGYLEDGTAVHGKEIRGIEQAIELYKWHKQRNEWETDKYIIDSDGHIPLELWNIPKV